MSFFVAFRSIVGSCENLHRLPMLSTRKKGEWINHLSPPHKYSLSHCKVLMMVDNIPLSQLPALKNWHRILFGSAPNGIFCTWTGLKSAATSAFAASAAFFSASRRAFSASFRFCSGVPPAATWLCKRAMVCCALAPFFYGEVRPAAFHGWRKMIGWAVNTHIFHTKGLDGGKLA